MSVMDVIRAVHNGIQRAKEEFNSRAEVCAGEEPYYDANIIVCVLRYCSWVA